MALISSVKDSGHIPIKDSMAGLYTLKVLFNFDETH